ncbi:MAG: flavin reductase family protein [Saprospiraceae bacterium]
MLQIDPKAIATKDLHQFIVGAVAPRPIAWASTMDEEGNPNLAPYSFFNAFSSNPPIVVFSSNRRVSNNTTKDTLHNIEKTGEVVINMVNYALVRQMAVTGVEFPKEVNEFEKAGLTMIHSELVSPYRVKESPIHFECKLEKIIPLGDKGGAGHLIICNIVMIHIDENVLDENQRINPHKLDLVGRLGRAYYTRASGDSIFTVAQTQTDICIGFDALPKAIQESKILTGNNIGHLAGLLELPALEDVLKLKSSDIRAVEIISGSGNAIEDLQRYAKELLESNNVKLGAEIAFLSALL